MAYKRKRTSSRKFTRRTRRRYMKVRRPLRSNNRHMFKRCVELTPQMGAGIGTNKTWSYAAKLNDLPSVTEFSTLYDQYRINGIKYSIVPNWTALDLSQIPIGAGGEPPSSGWKNTYADTGLPNIHSVIDYDNTDMPGYTTASMMQYATYKRTRGHREHHRYWKPAITSGEYASDTVGGTAFAGVKWKQWLDITHRDIPHYGIKVLMDPFPIGLDTFYDFSARPEIFVRIYVTFYFECRGVR